MRGRRSRMAARDAKIPAPTTGSGYAGLGFVAGDRGSRPDTAGDDDYRAYAASGVGQGRAPDSRQAGRAWQQPGAPGSGWGARRPRRAVGGWAAVRLLSALQLARLPCDFEAVYSAIGVSHIMGPRTQP